MQRFLIWDVEMDRFWGNWYGFRAQNLWNSVFFQRSKGFQSLKGVDYCQKAVDLSAAASKAEREEEEDEELVDIEFEV